MKDKSAVQNRSITCENLKERDNEKDEKKRERKGEEKSERESRGEMGRRVNAEKIKRNIR